MMKGCRMAHLQHVSISSRKRRMVIQSLLAATVIGALLLATGSGALVVAGITCSALLGSFLCVRVLSRTVAEIRADQFRVVASLQLTEDISSIQAEQDDIKAISSFDNVIIEVVENRRKERQHLLDQIIAAEEQLKVIIHNLITGDNKEVAQVRDAVLAMESMKSAFATV